MLSQDIRGLVSSLGTLWCYTAALHISIPIDLGIGCDKAPEGQRKLPSHSGQMDLRRKKQLSSRQQSREQLEIRQPLLALLRPGGP